jgi:hypothetical protein
MTSDENRFVTREVLHSLTLDTTPWLSCDDCFDRMDVYVERLLADPAGSDEAMAKHLAACAACAEEVESLRALLEGQR